LWVTNVGLLAAVRLFMEPMTITAARVGRASLLRLQPDERLAALAALGQEPAFEVLVRRYRLSLVRACQRILPDGRAEDAVQQALLSAYQALRRHGPPDRFRPWLHRIAVNAAIKMASEPAATRAPEALAGGEQPDEGDELRERVRSTLRAISALPARQRRALVARELEGRSHQEIARELGLSGDAVRQLIHRARTSVRAAASALVPQEALLRMLERAGPEASGRVAEVVAPGAGAALGTKLTVAAVLAGGVAGGAALAPPGDDMRPKRASAEERAVVQEPTGGPEGPGGTALPAPTILARTSNEDGGGGGDDDRSGHGSGKTDLAESGDNSGPGGGDDSSSGPSEASGSSGSSESGIPVDSSGPSSSGTGSSDSGTSGSDSSGSVSSVSDSSGSGSSGSGTSGSG
jgi:RNA polymerase sigma factor (sigma-70 family)